MRIFLIRHCESEVNRDVNARAKFADCDIPLSNIGMEHRATVGKMLRDALASPRAPVKIFHSPYLRVRQTLDGILPQLGGIAFDLQPPDNNLRDMNKGDYWPFTHAQRLKKWENYVGYQKIRDHGTAGEQFTLRAPNGESLEDVVKRARVFAQDLKKKCGPDDDIVIVCHDAVLCGLLQVLLHTAEQDIPARVKNRQEHPHNGSIRLVEGKDWASLKDSGYVHVGTEPPHAVSAHVTRAGGAGH